MSSYTFRYGKHYQRLKDLLDDMDVPATPEEIKAVDAEYAAQQRDKAAYPQHQSRKWLKKRRFTSEELETFHANKKKPF